MLGLGSYTFRWWIGHKGLVPDVPMTQSDMLDVAVQQELKLVPIADNASRGRLSADELEALESEARKSGLALEFCTQSFKVDEMREYLDIAGILDANCVGEWSRETVATLAAHTINLHLKDYDVVPDTFGVGFAIHGTPLRQGHMYCNAVLIPLPQDCDINVILEHWQPLGDDLAKACELEHQWLDISVAFARQELAYERSQCIHGLQQMHQ